jgi:hypothetical protein
MMRLKAQSLMRDTQQFQLIKVYEDDQKVNIVILSPPLADEESHFRMTERVLLDHPPI